MSPSGLIVTRGPPAAPQPRSATKLRSSRTSSFRFSSCYRMRSTLQPFARSSRLFAGLSCDLAVRLLNARLECLVMLLLLCRLSRLRPR